MATPKQKPGLSQQDYRTPDSFAAPMRRLLGITAFAFDFAADTGNMAERYYTKADDALSKPRWGDELACGDWGWLNPPFAHIAPWAAKCAETKRDGGQVAFLVPAAVGSDWFAHHVWKQSLVLLLRGRIPFMPEKPTWGYPKDCILCLYSPQVEPGITLWDWRREDLALRTTTTRSFVRLVSREARP